MKKCSSCKNKKLDSEFSSSQYKKSGGICRPCNTAKMKIYRDNNLEKINNYNKIAYQKYQKKIKQRKIEYYKNNKEKIINKNKNYYLRNKYKKSIYSKKYYQKNKCKILQKIKDYYRNNKSKINALANMYLKRKRQLNIGFRLRCAVSANINFYLKNNNSSKKNISCLKYLNYSIDVLKLHLQNQFEPWMNWNNYGKYNSRLWNDNDVSTWTWQIDHIVPQSKLPYTKMTDNNFKKCWSLNNLRPLSSKQNFIDGVKRIRHKTPLY